MNLVVVDDSIATDEGDAEAHGLSVIIFKPELSMFPDVRAEDEIVQFRHMRLQVFQNALQAISTNWSAFTVFVRGEDGKWAARPERRVEAEEGSTLDRIAARTGHTAALVRTSPRKPQPSRKLVTIELLRPDLYFDLVAQVVRILPQTRPNQLSLLLADYTLNPDIHTNPTSFGLSSDLEHCLLLTTVWDNFVDPASRLREGQIVRFLNLRSKIINAPREGDFSSGGLVGVLHGDHANAEKIIILSDTAAEAVVVLERRRRRILLDDDGVSRVPLSQPAMPVEPAPLPRPTELDFAPTKGHPLTAILHDDVSVVAIRTALDCPQVPAKFAIKGRVASYHPPDVSRFSRRCCKTCAASLAPRAQRCPQCGDVSTLWSFVFGLEITDGFDSIKAIVAHQEAVRFFNGLLPTDLSADDASREYIEKSLASLIHYRIPSTFCIKLCRIASEEKRYFIFDTLLTLK